MWRGFRASLCPQPSPGSSLQSRKSLAIAESCESVSTGQEEGAWGRRREPATASHCPLLLPRMFHLINFEQNPRC